MCGRVWSQESHVSSTPLNFEEENAILLTWDVALYFLEQNGPTSTLFFHQNSLFNLQITVFVHTRTWCQTKTLKVGLSMSNVKNLLAHKSNAIIHVSPRQVVVDALQQMRDNRVRSVLVMEEGILVGIITQGDCAIKVLLPGLDAQKTPVSQVMTHKPVTVKLEDPLDGCMALMATRGFRHLPVLDANQVVGVVSIGDVVKDIIQNLERNVDDLMGYILTDSPGG